MEDDDWVEVQAFGSSWRFSAAAMSGLKPFGVQTPATLTAFILQLVPTDGLQIGDYYEIDYQQLTLSIQVYRDAIEVDLPS